MKTLICAALAATLFALGCSGAPEGPELGSKTEALRFDADIDPDPDPVDAAPPPPPPSAVCTDQTNDGVCQRYCCTETATYKRCSVLPCATPRPRFPRDPRDLRLLER
jgi:hypothetical protein